MGQIEFAHSDANDAGVSASIKCVAEDSAGNTYLTFNNGNPGSVDERLRIDSSGRIKIGPIANYASAVTSCPVYIEMNTDLTAINSAEGDANTGLVRIEETGSNANRYHGIELRNRQSGDIRLLNLSLIHI